MKKKAHSIFLAVPIAVAASVGAMHAKASCQDETAYQVPPTTYSKLNAKDAFERVAGGGGYTVIDMGIRESQRLSAREVSGPLYAVLDNFASEYRVEYRIRNCQVRLYPIGRAPNLKNYSLTAGRPIHEEISRWAAGEGWQINWTPEKSWRVFAGASIEEASAVDAVGKVVEYLRAEGKPIRLRIYAGNKVMEVESTDIRGGN